MRNVKSRRTLEKQAHSATTKVRAKDRADKESFDGRFWVFGGDEFFHVVEIVAFRCADKIKCLSRKIGFFRVAMFSCKVKNFL